MKRRSFLTLSALTAAAGATAPLAATTSPSRNLKLLTSGQVRTGGARMIDIGNGHHVWTKKVGDSPIKVLGAPGADHTYFKCFEDFLPSNGVEFYYYDQLDTTNSEKPNYPSLWSFERWRDEVEAVRKGLGLEDFYLLDHWWGGMLAIEYAFAYSLESSAG
jgi:proline iminopeptidase